MKVFCNEHGEQLLEKCFLSKRPRISNVATVYQLLKCQPAVSLRHNVQIFLYTRMMFMK